MARHTIRWTLIDALLSTLVDNPDLGGIQIEYGHPGEAIEQRYIYVAGDGDEGDLDIPVLTGDPAATGQMLTIDDDFKIHLVVGSCIPDATLREAKQDVETIVGTIEETFAGNPTLTDLDGLFWAVIKSKSGHAANVAEGAWATTLITINARGRYGGTVNP